MPALIQTKNPASLMKQFKLKLEERTGITSFENNSKARALIDVLQEELLSQNEAMANAIAALDPAMARDEQLEKIALTRGVTLKNASYALVTASERNLAFYCDDTFGSINSGSNITIPAGTLISSLPINNERGLVVEYRLLESVTLDAADSIGYVTAECRTIGTKGNVGAGVLTVHNFTSYAQNSSNTLKVINLYPIVNGQDKENSEQLRYRVSRNYDRLVQESDIRLKLLGLNIPGVLDVKTIPGYMGIGTVGVIVLGAENQTPASLVSEMQARVNNLKGIGLSPIVIPAVQVAFHIELKLKTKKLITDSQKNRFLSEARNAIRAYLRNTSIGSVINFNDMFQMLVSTVSKDIEIVPSSESGFNNLYMLKGLNTSGLSQRERIRSVSVPLEEDEYAELYALSITWSN